MTTVTVEDQMNDFRTISLRIPAEKLSEAMEHGQSRHPISRTTAQKIERFAYRAAIRTDDGPIRVMIEQDGPDDFYLLLGR